MRVLLTGGNGFVGSHILDALRAHDLAVRLLLRRTSDTTFIREHLSHVEVCRGAFNNAAALDTALEGMEVLIHCAGKTKAVRVGEYYEANHLATRNLVAAANQHQATLRQFILISSLAAVGPATAASPAREEDIPHPVSDYGRSKHLGEAEVREHCRVPFTILRPAAVFGPRDRDFLLTFRLLRWRLMPLLDGGRMAFSHIYACDLAAATLAVLGRTVTFGKTYHVAHPQPCTNREFLEEIAAQMHVRAVSCPLPLRAVYPLCLAQELAAGLTGKPSILSRQKLAELAAAGWVCSVERLRTDIGFVAPTSLQEGVKMTLHWYQIHGWL